MTVSPPEGTTTPKSLSSLQWIAIALGIALAVSLCIVAGRWQFSRHEDREAAIGSVVANYDSEPGTIAEFVPQADSLLPEEHHWVRVKVSGHYEPQFTALLRNRPINSTPGVHVLVPFITNDGHTLLINRGWVAQDANYERPSVLPNPPSGVAEIVVHLRPSEPDLDKTAPIGQVQMINVPDALAAGLEYGAGTQADLPSPYTQVYGSLQSEVPQASDFINPPPRPSTDPKNHLSYAFQWWVFAIGAVVGFGVLVVREVRLKRGTLPPSSNPFSQLAELERSEREASDSRKPAIGRKAKNDRQSEEEYEDSLFE